MSSELTWVTIKSPYSEKSYAVNLTGDEIERCETDSAFFASMCLKYDQLERSNTVRATVGSEDSGPSTSTLVGHAFETPNIENGPDTRREEAGPSQNVNAIESCLTLPEELEETFICLVQERPPLWNFKLPLRERSREVIERNWREIAEGLEVNIPIATLKSKWKSIRDSFIRARNNINRKISSGAPANERLEVEKLKARHKHYELLEFLTTNLDLKRTATNIAEDEEIIDNNTPCTSRSSFETPSTRRNTKERSTAESLSQVDTAFISAIQNLSNQQEKLTGTQHFCMRLVDGLERLPRVIRNNLELKILQLAVEAENKYLNDHDY